MLMMKMTVLPSALTMNSCFKFSRKWWNDMKLPANIMMTTRRRKTTIWMMKLYLSKPQSSELSRWGITAASGLLVWPVADRQDASCKQCQRPYPSQRSKDTLAHGSLGKFNLIAKLRREHDVDVNAKYNYVGKSRTAFCLAYGWGHFSRSSRIKVPDGSGCGRQFPMDGLPCTRHARSS